jgi:hypothetical protein
LINSAWSGDNAGVAQIVISPDLVDKDPHFSEHVSASPIFLFCFFCFSFFCFLSFLFFSCFIFICLFIFDSCYVFHPAVFDACLHSCFLALSLSDLQVSHTGTSSILFFFFFFFFFFVCQLQIFHTLSPSLFSPSLLFMLIGRRRIVSSCIYREYQTFP